MVNDYERKVQTVERARAAVWAKLDEDARAERLAARERLATAEERLAAGLREARARFPDPYGPEAEAVLDAARERIAARAAKEQAFKDIIADCVCEGSVPCVLNALALFTEDEGSTA